MTRLVHRPIEIQSWQNGEPDCFIDGDAVHKVSEIVDRWVEMGRWWEGEGSRRLLRVLTEQRSLFDIECNQQNWFIYRVWD